MSQANPFVEDDQPVFVSANFEAQLGRRDRAVLLAAIRALS